MTTDPYRDALAELLTAYAEGARAGAEVGAKLCKRKEVKEGFALLARCFKHSRTREFVLQCCVEAEESHPLHQAAKALALAGALPTTPWTPITRAARPKRWVLRLHVSRHAPVVYAVEIDSRVSVWSLETGELAADLALPGGKKAKASKLVELDDGTLRVACSDGAVAERAPGGKALVKQLGLGELRFGWACSPDLRYHVTRMDFQPTRGEVNVQRIAVHDAVKKTSRELQVPIDYPEGNFLWTDWAGGRVVFAGRRSVETGPDTCRDDSSLCIVDPVQGTFEQIAFDLEVQQVAAGARPGTLRLSLVRRDAEGSEVESSEVEYDLATRTSAPASAEQAPQEEEGGGWGEVALGGGRRYEVRGGTIVDAQDRVIGGYALVEDPYAKLAVWDAAREQLVLAGGDPAVSLTIVRPYDPRCEASASVAAAPPEPLAWARPGVRLTYTIADFDAEDSYTFAVLAAGEGLSLAIHMGDEEVAAAARFTAAALESATKSVAIAQGGADVDLSKEQAKVVPPIVIARASAAKLAAGKSLAWKSEWSEGGKLEGAARETFVVQVDGAERPLAAITASSEEATLTVLDDPRWPLVLARVEGDCHVRLEAIDMTRAEAAAPAKVETAKVETAKVETAPSGAARRFEMSEGGSQKFWEVAVEGPAMTVRFGKLGTAGTTQTKTFASAEAAAKEAEKLVREKTKKGYAPV